MNTEKGMFIREGHITHLMWKCEKGIKFAVIICGKDVLVMTTGTNEPEIKVKTKCILT